MLTISKLAPQVGRTIGNKKNIKIKAYKERDSFFSFRREGRWVSNKKKSSLKKNRSQRKLFKTILKYLPPLHFSTLERYESKGYLHYEKTNSTYSGSTCC